MGSKIMYLEEKDGITGPARIGRVRLSKTGKTLYYRNQQFQSLKGDGYKANYYDINSCEQYWISEPRKDGQDTLYPGIVEIDEDVRVDYWLTIRNQPHRVGQRSFRSEGKYSRRKPHPDKPNHPANGAPR